MTEALYSFGISSSWLQDLTGTGHHNGPHASSQSNSHTLMLGSKYIYKERERERESVEFRVHRV